MMSKKYMLLVATISIVVIPMTYLIFKKFGITGLLVTMVVASCILPFCGKKNKED